MYQRIRNLREDMDLTQTQVANYLNCSQRIYSNYERHIMVTKDDLNHALAEGQKDILSMLQHIDKKMDKGFTDVVEVQKALTEMYGDHEAAIRILRRRPV
jgi:transcriptional regulator with XRE-family HTH domain